MGVCASNMLLLRCFAFFKGGVLKNIYIFDLILFFNGVVDYICLNFKIIGYENRGAEGNQEQ